VTKTLALDIPTPPAEIADAVEMWARKSGRHGRLQFIPTFVSNGQIMAGTWLVRLSLRENDKRMLLYQQGIAAEPPAEDVWLHVPDESRKSGYRALDIYQMGVGGVEAFLDRGNMWSGRGEFTSLEEQVRLAREANRKMLEKNRADQKEESRHEQRDKRRWRFGIPFLPVGVTFPKAAEPTSTTDLAPAATNKEQTV